MQLAIVLHDAGLDLQDIRHIGDRHILDLTRCRRARGTRNIQLDLFPLRGNDDLFGFDNRLLELEIDLRSSVGRYDDARLCDGNIAHIRRFDLIYSGPDIEDEIIAVEIGGGTAEKLSGVVENLNVHSDERFAGVLIDDIPRYLPRGSGPNRDDQNQCSKEYHQEWGALKHSDLPCYAILKGFNQLARPLTATTPNPSIRI